jgi:tRNA U38,U39,U40 pseudouridine synthase TruA
MIRHKSKIGHAFKNLIGTLLFTAFKREGQNSGKSFKIINDMNLQKEMALQKSCISLKACYYET